MRFEDEARETLIGDDDDDEFIRVRKRPFPYELIIPWIFAIGFFCTTLYFARRTNPDITCRSRCEKGFDTDFVSSADPIPLNLVKKKFTNDLLYNTTSQSLYNQPNDPSEIKYIGDPSPAITKAWHDLLHAQYVALFPSEVDQFPASHIQPISYNGEHSFMELSVFHNLHCLNEIRLALDKDNEQDQNSIHQGKVHLDHCVDQIRQALMCQADLTPVPMLPVESSGDLFIGNGEIHTCRDFDAIWEWVEERGRKQKALGD